MRLASLSRGVSISIALTLCSGIVPAQKTWVVDAQKSAGSHFADLPEAVKAATHGDTILVRSGIYRGATIRVAIRLIGEPGARIQVLRKNGVEPLIIRDVPSGKTFVMRGMRFIATAGVLGNPLKLQIVDNAGSIHLQDVRVDPEINFGSSYSTSLKRPPGVDVKNSRSVAWTHSHLAAGTRIERSRVTITGGRLTGMDWSSACTVEIWNQPGLDVYDRSFVDLTGVFVLGGAGNTRMPMPAIRSADSAVVIRGGTFYAGGATKSKHKAPALLGSGNSTLVFDPTARLVASGKAPAHSGFARLAVRTAVCLDVAAVPTGIALDVRSPKGELFAIYASLSAPPALYSGAEIWLDFNTTVLLAVGSQSATEHAHVVLPVRAGRVPPGYPFAFQAVGGTPRNLRLSNPVIATID
jgi:hypothetical protein